MGFKIAKKENFGHGIFSCCVEAPRIARKHQPGQFIVLRVNETGERIPLTIVNSDDQRGTITIIFQVVGKTTALLSQLEEGDEILDVVGPLGSPTKIEKSGTVVGIGGGIGIAALYPIVKGLKRAGNKVLSIIGAQRSEVLTLESEMKEVSDELFITTDDGSKGHHGFVTDVLNRILGSGDEVNYIIAIGPLPMMKAVSQLSKPRHIKTMVSLNAVMVDGTGMCGGCRVVVGGEKKFACVDGPEFDGHKVDFDTLLQRGNAYREYEQCALERFKKI